MMESDKPICYSSGTEEEHSLLRLFHATSVAVFVTVSFGK